MVYTDFPRGYLWRCKIDGSEKLQLTDTVAQMPTWSPDSKWITYSAWNELYRVGKADLGRFHGSTTELVARRHGRERRIVSITPEGNVAAMSDNSVTQIYQMK